MSTTQAAKAIKVLFDAIVADGRIRRDDTNAIEFANGEYRCSVRYYGNWENPPEDRDEEDYDWQVPTPETAKRLDAIVAKIAAQYPTVTLSWVNEGEKNWLGFYAV